MQKPAIIATTLISGMVFAHMFLESSSTLYMISATATLFVALIISHFKAKQNLFALTAALFSFSLGATLLVQKAQDIAGGTQCIANNICIGTLTQEPQDKTRTTALRIELENGVEMLLYVQKDSAKTEAINTLHIGDTIIAIAKSVTETYKDKGPFANYNRYLFNHNVCATAYVRSEEWSTHPSKQTSTVKLMVKEAQQKLHETYLTHGIKDENAAIIEAMTIGRKADLSREERKNFSHAGISHVLALSGFHVGILLTIVNVLLLRKIIPIRFKWTASIITIPLLWSYVLVAGASPSLIRASIMCTIILTLQAIGQKAFSSASIALTAIIMLIYNPLYILDIGFQLSFASVAGICTCSSFISSLGFRRHFLVKHILQLIAISAVCWLSTMPLVAYHFGVIPTYSVLTNIIVTLFVILLMWTSVLWWFTLPFITINNLIGIILVRLASIIATIAKTIAALPGATFEWNPSFIGVVASYSLLFIILFLIRVISHSGKNKTQNP